MGKRIHAVASSHADTVDLGIAPMLGEHAVADALAQIQGGLTALRSALMGEAQRRAELLVGDLRGRVLDAEASVERALSHVPAFGPALAMRLFRATHEAEPVTTESMAPSNHEDASRAQLEPGGVASSAYLQHVGLA
jgi:hypothetical protein